MGGREYTDNPIKLDFQKEKERIENEAANETQQAIDAAMGAMQQAEQMIEAVGPKVAEVITKAAPLLGKAMDAMVFTDKIVAVNELALKVQLAKSLIEAAARHELGENVDLIALETNKLFNLLKK